MTKPRTAGEAREARLEKQAHEVFSSEKREDIWAIVIALVLLLFSILFPEGVYNLFNKVLYLF